MSDEPTVWEYRVATINTEYRVDYNQDIKEGPRGEEIIWAALNGLGRDGWELVAFLPALPEKDFRGSPKNPFVHYAIFKRPKLA